LLVDYHGSWILLFYLLHRHYFQHRCGQDWQIHSVQDFDGDYQNGHWVQDLRIYFLLDFLPHSQPDWQDLRIYFLPDFLPHSQPDWQDLRIYFL